jgi:hypothetical protein
MLYSVLDRGVNNRSSIKKLLKQYNYIKIHDYHKFENIVASSLRYLVAMDLKHFALIRQAFTEET